MSGNVHKHIDYGCDGDEPKKGDPLSSRRGSPERFRRVGMEGPKISVSRIPVLIPRRANDSARLTGKTSLVIVRSTWVHRSCAVATSLRHV